MDFQMLVDVYEQLEQTSSGNKLREILSEFFKIVPAEDIGIVSYLTLGKIASDYDDVNLGMAEKSIAKSIAQAGAIDIERVKKALQETGDIGLAAEKMLQKKPRTLVPIGTLSIHELFETLHKIAASEGEGSAEKKASLLASLLQKSSPAGSKYVTRIVMGTLRLGVGDMSVLDALAIAYTGDKKNKQLLERAYNICPDVGIIAQTIATSGLKGIAKIDVHVGRPIKMMLAQRVKSLSEVSEKIPGQVAVEGKYDGERIQVHKTKKGKIMLFSRRLENITSQFPDIVEALAALISASEFVLEGEVIAIDEQGDPLPFQTLMQRRRKYDVEEYRQKIPVQLKVFDLLYCNGATLLHQSYHKRSQGLERIVKASSQLTLTDRIITEDIKEIEQFFSKMLKAGYEGVMIKSLADDSEYQAGVRGWNWIKWKKEYAAGLTDTVDLVVVGAFYGRGRRSGTYGALLCAAYNQKEDTFDTVCKLGTGLSDELLKKLPGLFKKHMVSKKPARVRVAKEMEPEVWFEPAMVVEVLGAEVTKSPFHTSGLALRFPRFVQWRENKKTEQATTVQEIEEMFRSKG